MVHLGVVACISPSWEAYPGAGKYVVYRTVDDAGPYWRRAVKAPGLSFAGDGYPNQSYTTVAYEVAVRDASNTEIDRAACSTGGSGGGDGGVDRWVFGWDDNSNRVTGTYNGQTTTFSYDSRDRLTGFTGQSGAVTYDGRGNATHVDGVTLGWDATDRNTSLTSAGSTVAYERDATDRVTSRTEGGVSSVYLYGDGGDAPVGLGASGGGVTEWYVELFGGVSRTVKPVGQDRWLLPNIHADTLAVIGPDGVLVSGPHVYEPWGNPLANSGYPDFTAIDADYGWLGQHLKATETAHSNITQMGARPYHPGIGRFLSVDPIEGGTLNDYAYVHDPINTYDLDGKGLLSWAKDKASSVGRAVADPVGTVSNVGSAVWARRRQIAKIAITAGAVADAIACGASVVCGVAVGAAAGAASYASSKADTKDFTWRGMARSAAIGGVTAAADPALARVKPGGFTWATERFRKGGGWFTFGRRAKGGMIKPYFGIHRHQNPTDRLWHYHPGRTNKARKLHRPWEGWF